MDLLHVVNQASEALKMALEKPNRNRRKGGAKKTAVATAVTNNASKSHSGDGRVSKGKSLQRTFVCQQKVLEALFNPKVLHPTDDEQDQPQAEGTKSTASSLRARRLPASFFKGPSGQPGNNRDMSSCRQTNIELPNIQPSYGRCPPEFNTAAFPKQQHVACASPYHQSMACPTSHPNEQILHLHHHHHHQAMQPSYEVQNEVWTGEHCTGYLEVTHPHHHHLHNQDFYLRRQCANGCQTPRSQYDSCWDFHSASTVNYGTYACPVIESPTSVDSRGYASTLDDYSPSPETSFTADSSVFITNDLLSARMVENTNHLDVCCVDDFYGIAHSFPSTSHQHRSKEQETTDMAPRESTGSSNLQTTASVSLSNTSSPSTVNEASPLPEFSHAFGGLCT